MNGNMLLVHSPLVGPSVWAPLAARLTSGGAHVACPDLRGAVTTDVADRMQRFVDAAVDAAIGGDIVLIGFSGAGVMLPNIASVLGDRVRVTVFVDAVVPPAAGCHQIGAEFTSFIDTKTVDGLLEPWLDWWPDEVPTLLPDAALREAIAAEIPRVPRAFYDERLELPHGWSDRPNRYLQTSRAYDADRELAESYGWRTATINGTHLSIVTGSNGVAAALERLTWD